MTAVYDIVTTDSKKTGKSVTINWNERSRCVGIRTIGEKLGLCSPARRKRAKKRNLHGVNEHFECPFLYKLATWLESARRVFAHGSTVSSEINFARQVYALWLEEAIDKGDVESIF
uniref:Uncharacterized protein n=1 Tax=Candidatus Kentrum sp. DK TaxID=2126562 RepID=A0A450TIH4_9GAMM|nr:MAG: hypothetical protein BECKDK2373C_GA0170839_11603 [Candidatus Kentron sp. DK]